MTNQDGLLPPGLALRLGRLAGWILSPFRYTRGFVRGFVRALRRPKT